MKLDELLYKINDINEEIKQGKKLEIEDLININPYLTLDNPLTYAVFLTYRLDLSEEEIAAYKQYARLLSVKESRDYSKIAANMF